MLLVVISLALAACATTTPNLDGHLIPGIGGRDVLFAADLIRAHATTVYDAILEVRPDFFDRRALLDRGERQQPLHVYVDGADMGDIEALRTLPLGPVTSVRYVAAGDAEFHWLYGISGAAIVVTTAR
jgi:hypothetical protein